jgi:TetR/AcrR family transcriptional repressor of uid operon
MPKVLPEYLEQRRQHILDAAAACFTREGFHRTSMADICAEADMSPGAVYRYFRSKEEIIQAMCARGHQQDEDVMRNVMQLGGTLDILDELARIYLQGVEDHEFCAMSIELLSESRRDPVVLGSLREGNGAVLALLTEIARAAKERGEIDPAVAPESVANVLMALYLGLIWQKVIDPSLDTSAYAAAVKSLFHGDFWRGARTPNGTVSTSALQH